MYMPGHNELSAGAHLNDTIPIKPHTHSDLVTQNFFIIVSGNGLLLIGTKQFPETCGHIVDWSGPPRNRYNKTFEKKSSSIFFRSRCVNLSTFVSATGCCRLHFRCFHLHSVEVTAIVYIYLQEHSDTSVHGTHTNCFLLKYDGYFT